MNGNKIISIVGNIASGKTTLIRQLKEYFKLDKSIIFFEEPVDEWKAMLDKFYMDKKKYAFGLQQLILITYYTELKKLIDTHSNCIIIVERCHICNGKVFSQMLYEDGFITNDDYGLYKIMYNKYLECFCFDIDKVIYLKVEPSICWERYNIRNRTGELIDIEYLEKIETYYDAMINGLDDSVGIYKINGNEELQDIFHRLKRCLILENLHFHDKEKEFIHTTIENKV